MVIRIEMPKVHSQTLIYREYHKSRQRKREEPFKKNHTATYKNSQNQKNDTGTGKLHQQQNFLSNQTTHCSKRACYPYITPDQ